MWHGHFAHGGVTGKMSEPWGYKWHRAASPFYTVPQRFSILTPVLEDNGYENIEQFLNWERR